MSSDEEDYATLIYNDSQLRKREAAAAAAAAAAETNEEKPLFIAKIVDSWKGKKGKQYRTRWAGYGPEDDTWEPLENVAETGHVDHYERSLRERTLNTNTPGVAVVKYHDGNFDGKQQTIDLLQEKFREWRDDMNEDEHSTTDEVNNFEVVRSGGTIDLLWPFAGMYWRSY